MADDAFIADRILWRASKHGLPADDTFAFGNHPESVDVSIATVCSELDTGDLVLVFGREHDRWTVLGTRMAVTNFDSSVHVCSYSQIVNLTRAEPLEKKLVMQFVSVELRDGTAFNVWGPPGSQFFGLWNILLGLSRMSHGSGYG